MKNNPEFLVIHHTASARDVTTARAVDYYHRNKNWGRSASNPIRCERSNLGWYIQYHYFISANGHVTKCAQDDEIRWHSGVKANTKSIAICMAGRFDKGFDKAPTVAQLRALKELVQIYCERYNIKSDKIFGHRDFMNKTCPGNLISDSFLKSLVDGPMIDKKLHKKLLGKLVMLPEDHGKLYLITEKGAVYLGTTVEGYLAFMDRVRTGQVPHLGVSNEDFKKLPVLGG